MQTSMIEVTPVVRTSDVDTMSAQRGVPVTVTVGASVDNLGVMRALAETVLLSADFSVADAADVTLGVEEICAQIIARSAGSESVTCSLSTSPTGVLGEISGLLHPGSEMSTDGFGWHVVQAVTDTVGVEMSGRRVRVHFTRLRTED